MKLWVYSGYHNELAIWQYWYANYIGWWGAEKLICYNRRSTDGSDKVIARYPGVEVRENDFPTYDEENGLSISNNCWKEAREHNVDFVIIASPDELLWHPDPRGVLQSMKDKGITISRQDGYMMISDKFTPFDGRQYWEFERWGIPENQSCKPNLFDPNAIEEINFKPGLHDCAPTGNVKIEKTGIKLLHYRWMGAAFLRARSKDAYKDRSKKNEENGWGWHTAPDYTENLIREMRGAARGEIVPCLEKP